MKCLLAIIMFVCLFNLCAVSQVSPMYVGEMYFYILRSPSSNLTINVQLIGAGFVQNHLNHSYPKTYSTLDTSDNGVYIEPITGASTTIPAGAQAPITWLLDHVSKGGQDNSRPWIGYGLYEITLAGYDFYIDWLDTGYPYGETADVTITYDSQADTLTVAAKYRVRVTHQKQVVHLWSDLYGESELPVGTSFQLPSSVPVDSNYSKLYTTAFVSSNVSIPTGSTFTIDVNTYPDTTRLQPVGLLFNTGISCSVNGQLIAHGTASNPVVFDRSGTSGAWSGLVLNSSSGASTISYCKVHNADRGIYENGVGVNISNSAVANCTNGIYLYNSSPTIQNCNIHDNSYAGVYLISSSPNLYGDNWLQHNDYGVYCTTNSNPSFGSGSTQGKNYDTNNVYGVFCWNNSLPMLGQNSPVNGGYDNLVNTSWNVYNMSWNAIYAQNNWWGTTNQNNFKIAGTGGVAYSPYLTSSVYIPAPPLSKMDAIVSISSDSSGIPMQAVLDKAYQLFSDGDFLDTRNACLNLINNYPNYTVSFNALNLLTKTYASIDIAGVTGALQPIFNRTPKKDLYAAAGLLLANVDKTNRGKWLDQVFQSYGSQSVGELTLFDKFVWYYFDQQDMKDALGVSRQLDSLFTMSQGAAEAHRILGDAAYYRIGPNMGQSLPKAPSQTPTSYSLSEAYPNPFNPSTQISYSLPEAGKVALLIYDVLGREVANLADGYQQSGRYTVTWNSTQNSGIPVSSGVYFARLRVLNDIGGVTFTKTTKLLLMK